MAKLFDIVQSKIVIDPNVLAIPQIAKIWNRDKTINKEKAYKEISYVVFFCDYHSPYRDLLENDKGKIIIKDLFGNIDWEPDEKIKEAIEKYIQLQETSNMRLLKAAKSSVEKLAKYFEKVDFEEEDDFGKPVYSAKELASNLSSVGNIVKSLTALERQVKLEITESIARGSNEIGLYEVPKE